MLIRKNYFLYNVEKGGKELAGSVRLTVQENTWKLELQWKDNGAHLLESGDAVVLQHGDNEIVFSGVSEAQQPLQQSRTSNNIGAEAQMQSSQPVSAELQRQDTLPGQQQSQASADASLQCEPQPLQQSSTSNSTGAEQQMQSPQRQESVAEQSQPLAAPKSQMECTYMPKSTIPSYWETIRAQCDRIEGCAELGEVYRIGKGDFALLPEQLRHMLQNSFLIHGLMNYGYLILCCKEGETQGIRLGVPGVYYEKEKLVAEMFGFDSFWCQEKSDNGKFGYYLRIVA